MKWFGRRHDVPDVPDARDGQDQHDPTQPGEMSPDDGPVVEPEAGPLRPEPGEAEQQPQDDPRASPVVIADDEAEDAQSTEHETGPEDVGPVTAGPSSPPAVTSSRRERGARPRRLERGGLLWVLPAVLLLLVVTLWPLGRAVYDSLFQASLVTPDSRTFVGVEGYVSTLGSRTWWSAVATTLGFVAAAVALQLLLASAFATALRRVTHGARWLQALLLVPFGLLAVVTATAWRDGLTTGFGPQWFGYDGESAAAGVAALLASEVWRGTGITTLILLAGLARVSPALREAAIADGAHAWQRFWRVTRPAAAPAVAVAVTYRALDALRVLEAPLLASESTPRTVTLLVWDTTFESFELGLGAVVSVLLLVLAGLLGLVLSKGLKVRRVL